MQLPIYKLKIKQEDEETGVDFIAMVDDPAIELTWQAFSKIPSLFKATDQEKKIISGPLMVADLPIYRRDDDGREYYVVFDKETIEQIVQKYFRLGFTSNVNMMHDKDRKADGVYMFESFMINRGRGITPPNGFESLTDGSWFGSYKVDNQEIWDRFIKSGEFKGFSVEGIFDYEKQSIQDQDTIKKIIEIIQA